MLQLWGPFRMIVSPIAVSQAAGDRATSRGLYKVEAGVVGMTRRKLLPGSICRGGLTGRWQSFGLLLLVAGSTANGASKSRIELDPDLQFSDMAVLASRE